MKRSGNWIRTGQCGLAAGLTTALALLCAPVAHGFNLDSDTPIKITANSARLDDTSGTATYTGDVEVTQGETRLTADRVVLYRNAEGISQMEAEGNPAHYREPSRSGEGMTDARALEITWSAEESLVVFDGEAFIEQGPNEFRGYRILYDTLDRVVTAQGNPGSDNGDGRVEMVIQPRNTGNSDNGQGSDGSSQGQ